MMIRLSPFFTRLHVWIYRNVGGRFAGRTPAGGPILVLTTTERRSKEKRTVALGYLDERDQLLVVGSNGGQHKEPDWSHNLKADPNAEIEYGAGIVQTEVELLEQDEREEAWQLFIAAYPDSAQAQHWAGREFPVGRIPFGPADRDARSRCSTFLGMHASIICRTLTTRTAASEAGDPRSRHAIRDR